MFDVSNESDWVTGRAGMLYRDLTPDCLRSRVIVSHIRLPFDGEVPDYVHYHKVDFQMIYCLRGRIKVVYEDQGEPFWLETGDCVLQPPESRHRVLECTAGAEVLEVTSPAEHETFADRDMTLPTATTDPLREFEGQRFVRHVATHAEWHASEQPDFEECDMGIASASNGSVDVRVVRPMRVGATFRAANANAYLFPVIENETLVVEFLRF